MPNSKREAAIRERAAGLTLIRPKFRNVPTAISIDEHSHDELWVKDARFEDISGPAVIVSLEQNPRTEINFEDAVCRRVPVFALLRESGRKMVAPGEVYAVKTFSHGLHFPDIGTPGEIRDAFEVAALNAFPAPPKSDLPDLPARDSWVNIRTLGAKGDGATDDTEAFRKAIAAHRAIYIPMPAAPRHASRSRPGSTPTRRSGPCSSGAPPRTPIPPGRAPRGTRTARRTTDSAASNECS